MYNVDVLVVLPTLKFLFIRCKVT